MSVVGLKTQLVFNFIAGTLLIDRVGTDEDSGRNSFDLKAPNRIEDITSLAPITSGETQRLFTTRLNNVRTRLGTDLQFQNTFTGDTRPNMPKGLATGTVQFVANQIGGTARAYDMAITTITPLIA